MVEALSRLTCFDVLDPLVTMLCVLILGIASLQLVFGPNVTMAAQDPSYPVISCLISVTFVSESSVVFASKVI
jgi:hypothetical protein